MKYNYSRYKRVFAFGCSFTSYHWPTWADIIASECVNARFYNFGRSGMGNLAMSVRVAEAHNKFKFDKDDLIIVLWSSYSREDRWLTYDGEQYTEKWICFGNVWNSAFYGKDFTKKFADPLGYLIRDLGLIYSTHSLLDNLPCDSIKLFSYKIKKDLDESVPIERDRCYHKIYETYKDFIETNIKNTMFDTIWEQNRLDKLNIGYTYFGFWNKIDYDPHPNTLSYYKWLQTCDINLSDISKQYAEQSYQKLLTCKSFKDIIKVFTQQQKNQEESYILLV